MATPLQRYLFDLNGFLVLPGALSAAEVADCNACLDGIPRLRPGEWWGHMHATSYGTKDGLNYQQVYELGEPFERLIDHPSWIDLAQEFVGGEGTFDHQHGPLFIDECFANFRAPGEAIGLHSGGHTGTKRTQFRFRNGRFHCGQINILMALNDIGPGDGATMVIPGSHKANFVHPQLEEARMREGGASVDGVAGAIEVHLRAGDALLFVDAISHGSAKRVNPGERRVCIYRYGPSWGTFRHGYEVSEKLLERLTPRRRGIVQPHRLLPRTPDVRARMMAGVG